MSGNTEVLPYVQNPLHERPPGGRMRGIMTKVSVIVPVYNAEKYLQRCVDSILSSRFRDFELILVNDGSVDQSRSLCKWYERNEKRIIMIDQEHQGTSAARNRGIRESHGEWVIFVDSDDLISNDFLSLVVQKEYASQDLLIFDYDSAPKGIHALQREPSFKKAIPKRQYGKEENPFLVERMLYCRQLIKKGHTDLRSVWAKAYKRELIRKYSLTFPEELAMGEDQIFQLSYQMKTNCCTYLKKAVYYVETRPDSVTRSWHSDTWKHYLQFIRHLGLTLKCYPCYPVWEKAYQDAVCSNLKGLLVMGIFHPQNSLSSHGKYELCRKIRRTPIIRNAVKKCGGKTGEWNRKGLLFFFRIGCYPVVEIICRIGHMRMKWQKR